MTQPCLDLWVCYEETTREQYIMCGDDLEYLITTLRDRGHYITPVLYVASISSADDNVGTDVWSFRTDYDAIDAYMYAWQL